MSARIPLALAPMAPPQSEVHRVISEADALAARPTSTKPNASFKLRSKTP